MESPSARAALWRSIGDLARDPRVRAALADTPRELYVPDALRGRAYEDRALPLGSGQTVSQPTIVAMTTDAVAPHEHELALDVGTGSGYQAAVLARLVGRVYGIELLPELARRARRNLAADRGTGDRVRLVVGDAHLGFPARIRFDVIVLAAAPLEIPPPILAQLAPGGRLVAPVGPTGRQDLVRIVRRLDGTTSREVLTGCAFVPLVRR